MFAACFNSPAGAFRKTAGVVDRRRNAFAADQPLLQLPLPRLLLKSFIACCVVVAASVSHAELAIENAWVRAVPPNSRTTAAYFTVRNSGDEEQVIIRASASVAGAAEIHDWVETDGRKKMVRQHQVSVPAGAQVVLQTGGLHMMLFRLDPVPAAGELVRLCVGVADQPDVCADAVVKMP